MPLSIRIFAAFVLVGAMGTILLAKEKDATIQVGDSLIVELSGDVAMAFSRATNLVPNGGPESGLTISTSATVLRKDEAGRLHFRVYQDVKVQGKPPRLVTLTGAVEPSQIESRVTPANTPVYSAPPSPESALPTGARKRVAYANPQPVLTKEASTQFELKLSELKGLKLRTWTLAEEIGK